MWATLNELIRLHAFLYIPVTTKGRKHGEIEAMLLRTSEGAYGKSWKEGRKEKMSTQSSYKKFSKMKTRLNKWKLKLVPFLHLAALNSSGMRVLTSWARLWKTNFIKGEDWFAGSRKRHPMLNSIVSEFSLQNLEWINTQQAKQKCVIVRNLKGDAVICGNHEVPWEVLYRFLDN